MFNREPKKEVKVLPGFAPYPGSNESWRKIPLGIGTEGEVFWDVNATPQLFLTGMTGQGKSVIQRNIINHCIQHPHHWAFMGIDLRRVELAPYEKYEATVTQIAKYLESGTEVLRDAHRIMMERYTTMQDRGLTNVSEIRERPRSIMVMIDDANLYFTQSYPSSENADTYALQDESRRLVKEIARLGRAAGVHLTIATQRPLGLFDEETLANFNLRISAGWMDEAASTDFFNNKNASNVTREVRGRSYIKKFGDGEEFQAYYAPQHWIDKHIDGDVEWLSEWSHPLNHASARLGASGS